MSALRLRYPVGICTIGVVPVLWSCKETVTKALGLDLASTLRKVAVILNERLVRLLSIDADLSIINKHFHCARRSAAGRLAALVTPLP
jgi:hypothetical protein